MTKDRVTRTPLKTRSELRCSGRVSSSCSSSVCMFLSVETDKMIPFSNQLLSLWLNKFQLILCVHFHSNRPLYIAGKDDCMVMFLLVLVHHVSSYTCLSVEIQLLIIVSYD